MRPGIVSLMLFRTDRVKIYRNRYWHKFAFTNLSLFRWYAKVSIIQGKCYIKRKNTVRWNILNIYELLIYTVSASSHLPARPGAQQPLWVSLAQCHSKSWYWHAYPYSWCLPPTLSRCMAVFESYFVFQFLWRLCFNEILCFFIIIILFFLVFRLRLKGWLKVKLFRMANERERGKRISVLPKRYTKTIYDTVRANFHFKLTIVSI